MGRLPFEAFHCPSGKEPERAVGTGSSQLGCRLRIAMRALVTGGAGFIGSHLADRLLAEGHQVVVVDNESTGRRCNVPTKAHYHKCDVTSLKDLDPVFAEGFDVVLHVAGQVSLIRSFADPSRDLQTNVLGTINVLRLCLEHRVK